MKSLHWNDILMLMDIKLIHKLCKYNVVPNLLNHKEEFMKGRHLGGLWILN
jgi:hypothetical protein